MTIPKMTSWQALLRRFTHSEEVKNLIAVSKEQFAATLNSAKDKSIADNKSQQEQSLEKINNWKTETYTEFDNLLKTTVDKLVLVEINDENHQSNIYIIKLNENSDYIFKFEVYKHNKYDINEILWLLKMNASDPVFPGYPYGLIEADKFARISNTESNSLRMEFMAKAGTKWSKIKQFLNTINAHSILDKIS